jgi:hypothetical protein
MLDRFRNILLLVIQANKVIGFPAVVADFNLHYFD